MRPSSWRLLAAGGNPRGLFGLALVGLLVASVWGQQAGRASVPERPEVAAAAADSPRRQASPKPGRLAQAEPPEVARVQQRAESRSERTSPPVAVSVTQSVSVSSASFAPNSAGNSATNSGTNSAKNSASPSAPKESSSESRGSTSRGPETVSDSNSAAESAQNLERSSSGNSRNSRTSATTSDTTSAPNAATSQPPNSAASQPTTEPTNEPTNGPKSEPPLPETNAGSWRPAGQAEEEREKASNLTSALAGGKLSGHLRFEFQRYDGWYNNLANSDWGTPNSRLRRKVAPAYSDGVYQLADEGRPSARLLSQRMMRGDDGLASRRNLTTMFAFFGQLISSEILMASESGCPIEMHRIKIQQCDPMYDRECRGGRSMPFYRAAYDPQTGQSPNLPREQLNRVTSWIDGSFIYSTSETWLNTMRSFDGRGTLKMVDKPTSASASASSSSSTSAAKLGPNGAAGDAHLRDTLAQLLESSQNSEWAGPASEHQPSGGGNSGGSAAAAAPHLELLERLRQQNVPLALFGYPVRNKQRAPLINQMPAHHLQMKTAERMFLLGDPRTNQNPMILTFAILFYRWHNVLAERIHRQHPDWSDEEIFQRARRLVIASLQNIFLYEYLPTLLGTPSPYEVGVVAGSRANSTAAGAVGPHAQAANSPDARAHTQQLQSQAQFLQEQSSQADLVTAYSGYKPDLHPGISHVFQSAAFRFGHTMIPPGLYLRDDKCHFLSTPAGHRGVRLCSTWWNAEEVVSRVGVERLLMGAASQIAEREDYVLCNDVRDKLFGPLDFSRRDLAALNIMRGRDNGLPDYNTVRLAFRLPRVTRWRDINPQLHQRQPELFRELAQLYGNRLDNVDLYIGGMLESDLELGRPGPLFRRIIKEQFERLRDADRFWFENSESGIFSETEIEEIRRIRLYDIIVNATLIPEHAIQRNVFQFVHAHDPCPQPGQLSSGQLQPCYIVRGHSYFKGNEQTYAAVCLTLALVPLACALAALLILRRQDGKRRRLKAAQQSAAAGSSSAGANISPSAAKRRPDDEPESAASDEGDEPAKTPPTDQKSKADKMRAKEWLHPNLKRKVKLRLGPAPDPTLYVLDRRGQEQRRLSLADSAVLLVELSVGEGALAAAPTHPLRAVSASPSGSRATLASSTASLVSGSVDLRPEAEAKPEEQQPQQLVAAALPAEQWDALDGDQEKPVALLRAARHYDLVLQFASNAHRRKFLAKLSAFLAGLGKSLLVARVARHALLANAETRERRQQRLDQFFREAYALTFGLADSQASSSAAKRAGSTSASSPETSSAAGGRISPDVGLVMRTSLSRQEFAEALGMRSDSLFVKQMFNCIDRDRNGQISFQEFLDLVVKFSRGKPEDRLRIVFDMCDHTGRGLIQKDDLVRVLRSLVDIARTKALTEEQLIQMIDRMFQAAGLADKPLLDYDDFQRIISSSDVWSAPGEVGGASTFGSSARLLAGSGPASSPHDSNNCSLPIGLDMKGAKRNFCAPPMHSKASAAADPHRPALADPKGEPAQSANHAPFGLVRRTKSLVRRLNDSWKGVVTELEEHRQDIVYLVMFFVILTVLFLERFINYSFLSEHMDLRHVMGVGIAITRGSAASLSFCYAMLLLSMCRNLMTWIRTMGVREYIPLDSHVKFHKIVAITALVMTVLHTVGHCVNFYHVTQQPVEHLRCLTKEMQFSPESRPTFFYWIFQTVTGSTGLALWILCSIIYVFAHQQVRQRAYNIFWSTHKLYYLIYALTLLHGSSKLTGSPRFWIFFIIPAILFTIDKIMSLKAKLWQLEIFETECLPSDVIAVKFARPPSFKFLSGQWVRVACTAFRSDEFHAFTLTSAPQADHLSIHVRAQGPWTWKLRSMFDPANLQYNKLLHNKLPPRIRIEGPFGGGNQDWYKYEVAVMIGGGIGVTPYASILQDLVFGTSNSRYSSVNYKKVYFIWICPSHRNFEWFIDVLRDVEERDVTNLLEMHIFITQFFHKFDLRTTMLYICENHFRRISNRSLFTGLKAANHFGRPDLASFLQEVQNKHSCVNKVGVFSCGPKAMTKSVTEACEKVNKRRKLPFFLHQYENFS